eukprot:jgi/Mesen1/4577/ME000232S03841
MCRDAGRVICLGLVAVGPWLPAVQGYDFGAAARATPGSQPAPPLAKPKTRQTVNEGRGGRDSEAGIAIAGSSTSGRGTDAESADSLAPGGRGRVAGQLGSELQLRQVQVLTRIQALEARLGIAWGSTRKKPGGAGAAGAGAEADTGAAGAGAGADGSEGGQQGEREAAGGARGGFARACDALRAGAGQMQEAGEEAGRATGLASSAERQQQACLHQPDAAGAGAPTAVKSHLGVGAGGSAEVPAGSSRMERTLLRWGHAAVVAPAVPALGLSEPSIVIFGGYGGPGAHARLNDVVVVSPRQQLADLAPGPAGNSGGLLPSKASVPSGNEELTGGAVEKPSLPYKARVLATKGPAPTPRVGHTASLVGELMVVTGGREGPTCPLGEVHVLNLRTAQWHRPTIGSHVFAPRYRHSAAAVGSKIYVFGGLAHPQEPPLEGLQVLDTATWQWSQPAAAGHQRDGPSARHSHAMTAVGSKVYVSGGRSERQLLPGDLFELNSETLRWRRIQLAPQGEPLAPCFSHTLTPVGGGNLLLLGGCPAAQQGRRAVLVNPRTAVARRIKLALPPRVLPVRHTACLLDRWLLVVGGGAFCFAFGSVFSQSFALNLLDSSSSSSCSVPPPAVTAAASANASASASESEEEGVRSGSAEMEVSLVSFSSSAAASHAPSKREGGSPGYAQGGRETLGNSTPLHMHANSDVGADSNKDLGVGRQNQPEGLGPPAAAAPAAPAAPGGEGRPLEGGAAEGAHLCAGSGGGEGGGEEEVAAGALQLQGWALMVPRGQAKGCKDALRSLRWLDDTWRQVAVLMGGSHVAFPLTEDAAVALKEVQGCCVPEADGDTSSGTGSACSVPGGSSGRAAAGAGAGAAAVAGTGAGAAAGARGRRGDRGGRGVATAQMRPLLEALREARALQVLALPPARRRRVSPHERLRAAVGEVAKAKGASPALLRAGWEEELPSRWERLGDMVILPAGSLTSARWQALGDDLWVAIASALNAKRVARQAPVANTGTRDSRLALLLGHDSWVEHAENGMLYCLDAARCMFSSGNVSEKLRVAQLACSGETVVDLYAGIGYYTLPFLLKAKAEHVYACEWNPHALAALRHNVRANGVEARCTVLEGDNRVTAPPGVAHRVNLGLIPSSEASWPVAIRALRAEGGVLHVHGNALDTEVDAWSCHVAASLQQLAEEAGRHWKARVQHVERVKWYAPHILHLVVDVALR